MGADGGGGARAELVAHRMNLIRRKQREIESSLIAGAKMRQAEANYP